MRDVKGYSITFPCVQEAKVKKKICPDHPARKVLFSFNFPPTIE